MKRLLPKLSALILTLALSLTLTPLSAFSSFGEEADDYDNYDDYDNGEDYNNPPVITESRFYLPGNMRAVILYPENEFIVKDESVFDEISRLGMNAVVFATSDAENAYYSSDVNLTEEPDYLLNAINAATRRNLNVYLIFDINSVLYKRAETDERLPINALITELHKFALKYPCEGIILDDYYSEKDGETFGRYMSEGAGIGYKNWLFSSVENYFKTAADIIHLTDNSIPVGIMLNDPYINALSETGGDFEAYSDGFADTKAFIEDNYADFAFVRAKGAYTDSESEPLPFSKITEWWGRLCANANAPMYIVHHNENVGEQRAGWNSEDQLLRQLTAAEDVPAYRGGAFNSYPALLENVMGTTDTLMNYFDNKIDKESIFEDLIMLAPKSLSYSTNDALAIFQGTYDDNFDVYFNGERITLNEAGNFYIEEDLSIGMNYYTIKHKGKEINYSIERKVIALYDIDESIANGKILNVDGGARVTISAIAYKGATVTATLNGQDLKLTEQESKFDDPELNTSYALFTRGFKVPDGIIEEVQDLGTIKVTASYQGYSRYMEGATVKVNALPKPPPPPEVGRFFDQDSIGSGEVVGYIDPVRYASEAVEFVKILSNNTIVFSSDTTGAAFNPEFCRLPAGTLDYYKSTSGEYYTTESGKRVSSDDAIIIEGTGLDENNLVVVSSGASGFKIKLDARSSFNIKVANLDFYTERGEDFNIRSFDASYIYVDFDNVTSVTKLPSFESSSVFSGGRWEAVASADGIPKFRMILELRQRGVYNGNYSYYDADGMLTLMFTPVKSSLYGMTIVIDPGHGYGMRESSLDPGSIGHIVEFDANLAIAKLLKTKLEEMGATVIRLPTENTFLLTKNRPDVARQYDCDLFIALHCNASAGNSGARGPEAWYFTPFSQPLAESISANIASYFQNNVYSDGANMNRGPKYSYYWVTTAQDFPSVLVEMGFVTNKEDAMALYSDVHRDGIATAIAEGVRKYVGG